MSIAKQGHWYYTCCLPQIKWILISYLTLMMHECSTIVTPSDAAISYKPITVDNWVDVSVYSRGWNHYLLNMEYSAFIKINNGWNAIYPAERGFNIVILDKLNGSIISKMKMDTYNSSEFIQLDMELAEYLSSIKQDDIILITVFGSITDDIQCNNPIFTLNVLQSFGCNISYIGHRASFVFIGKANKINHPLWTYCDTNHHLHSNGSILKTLQIPLSDTRNVETELIDIERNDTVYHMDIITDIANIHLLISDIIIDPTMIIAICMISVCYIIPLSIVIAICCCIYRKRKNNNINNKQHNQINDEMMITITHSAITDISCTKNPMLSEKIITYGLHTNNKDIFKFNPMPTDSNMDGVKNGTKSDGTDNNESGNYSMDENHDEKKYEDEMLIFDPNTKI